MGFAFAYEQGNNSRVVLFLIELNVSGYFRWFSCLQDEEGRTGPFVDKIREQEKLEKTVYVKEIEAALGGGR